MASRAVSLAKQVADLRGLVEQHLARTKPHRCLQIIFHDGASDEEIERLKAEAAAEEGVAVSDVTLWIYRRIITPKPTVEPPSPLRSAPYAERDNTLAEPRKAFERKPDATVVEPAAPVRTERPERPVELDYPDAGTWK